MLIETRKKYENGSSIGLLVAFSTGNDATIYQAKHKWQDFDTMLILQTVIPGTDIKKHRELLFGFGFVQKHQKLLFIATDDSILPSEDSSQRVFLNFDIAVTEEAEYSRMTLGGFVEDFRTGELAE